MPPEPARERARLADAFERTAERYRTMLSSTHRPSLADTLRFHAAIVADPDLQETAYGFVDDGLPAETALERSFGEAIGRVGRLGGYLGARAEDFREVRDRVMDKLSGTHVQGDRIRFHEPTVVVCDRLTFDALTHFDIEHVVAVLAADGGLNSHAAIILQSEGIAVVIDPYLAAAARDGEIIAVQVRRASSGEGVAAARTTIADGIEIEVAPLVNALAETSRPGFAAFAGIGLIRTEFAALASGRFPTLEEQYESYRRIATTIPGKPVCFRLFDVAPDKPVAHNEKRIYGARYLVEHPAILEDQLTALLMTAVGHEVEILVPMVENPADWNFIHRCAGICAERVRELCGVEGVDYRLGAMIESAAAIRAFPSFADVRFVSIGSNDLVADLFALLREREGFDPNLFLDPLFLEAVARVVAEAERLGIRVSVCGGAADDAAAIRGCVRAGIRHFVPSVSAAYSVIPTLARG
ncbi:MAG: putative PEP-binding protein [Candidatus Izemoplasmatales bacterium]